MEKVADLMPQIRSHLAYGGLKLPVIYATKNNNLNKCTHTNNEFVFASRPIIQFDVDALGLPSLTIKPNNVKSNAHLPGHNKVMWRAELLTRTSVLLSPLALA